MKQSEIITLFDFAAWANAKIMQAAAGLEPEQLVVAPPGHAADLRSILAHVVSVDRLWRARLEQGISPEHLRPEQVPTLDDLARRWQEEQVAMRAYLATLDDAALEDTARFTRQTAGLSPPFVRWQMLMQCITHGVQHRAEAAALLTAYGRSPGDLDFFFYVLEHMSG